jgi:CheY-like chemotaxis protein
VEDNEINLEITSELLKYVKVTVETAKDGYGAIKLFEESGKDYYEIILMDVQMPGLNGYETAKAIRASKHPDADKVLIIAMSADTSSEDMSYHIGNGMNYHIAKPIDINYFYSILDKIFTKKDTFLINNQK